MRARGHGMVLSADVDGPGWVLVRWSDRTDRGPVRPRDSEPGLLLFFVAERGESYR